MNFLRSLEKEINQCVKCGACRAHCPVFSEIGREPTVARGKIALAKAIASGTFDMNDRTCAELSRCLLCGTCTARCPNDVPTAAIVIAARHALAENRGLASLHSAIRHLLRNPGLLKLSALFAGLLNPFILRKVPGTSGLRLRFPLPFLPRKRHFPKITTKAFLDRHPDVIEGQPGKPRVAYFIGCMTNYVYPQIGEAVVTLLKQAGCTVIIPKGQGCCGFPAMSGGDLETASILAKKNLSVLLQYQPEYIVTACASCRSALRELYTNVVARMAPELAERVEKLAGKVIDAAALLHYLGFKPKRLVERTKVTYHDPCHLRNGGITMEPRALLNQAAGVDYVEMENAGSCCGLGGTFSVYHYPTAMAINAGKAASIGKTGACIVATACPGCIFQITDGLQQRGMSARVVHILDLLAGGKPVRR